MKTELCAYSGYKIHPGHGKKLIKLDGRVFWFLSKKCERSHLMKRNPREISWTVLYRRKHKKGQQEEISKRRTRKTVKHARPLLGASVKEIEAKRAQPAEVRQAQRASAIKAAKEKQRAKDAEKKVKKQALLQAQRQQQKGKVAKPAAAKGPGRVGGKR